MSSAKPKVLLILERSEDSSVQVGITRNCQGSMPMDISKCDVVGTWGRYDGGTLYIEVTTPIEALQDRLTQLISERAKSIEMATYPIIFRQDEPLQRRVARPKTVHVDALTEVPSIDFSNLRARLGKG